MFSHTRSFIVYSPVRLFSAPGELLSKKCFLNYFGSVCGILLRFFGFHGRQLVPDAAEQFLVAHPELFALYQ